MTALYNNEAADTQLAYYQGCVGYLIIHDRKVAGTAGGDFNNGAWRTRDLNTVVFNSISGASLAANQITLPAGSYLVVGSAPAFDVGYHVARLRNITDGATLVNGQNAYTGRDPGTGVLLELVTTSIMIGKFSISGPKVVELQHQCQTTKAVNGFGTSINATFAVDAEIYSMIKFIKVA